MAKTNKELIDEALAMNDEAQRLMTFEDAKKLLDEMDREYRMTSMRHNAQRALRLSPNHKEPKMQAKDIPNDYPLAGPVPGISPQMTVAEMTTTVTKLCGEDIKNAEFVTEWSENMATFMKAGISMEDYVQSRRVDVGLDSLTVKR